MSQEPCECLKRWDTLGIVFVYLAMLRNDPKWVRLTVKCKSRWMKREEKCALSTVSPCGSHPAFWKMPRCQRSAPGQHCCFLSPGSGMLRDAQGTSPGIRHSRTSYQREFSPGVNSRSDVFHLLPFLFSLCCLFSSFLLSLAVTVFLENSKKYLSAHGLQEKAC